jgi:hypothetical protein
MCLFGCTWSTCFLCWWISGAGVFSDILNVRGSYALGLGSHATVFQSEVYAILACSYCISEGIVNREISICSDSRAGLLALYYSVEILFRNWLCLTEFDWCGSLNIVVSMEKGGRRTCKSGIKFCFCGAEPCLSLAPSRKEREWVLKSHCASWSLETTGRQSRICLKKPNSGLTRYLLRLPRSKLRILMRLITGHCPSNKYLHGSCICAYLHRLWDGRWVGKSSPSLISLRMRTFSKLILGVEEYEGRARASASALLRFALTSGTFTVTPCFVLMNISFVLSLI